MFGYDEGLINLALESEIELNNLYTELLREEPLNILFSEDDNKSKVLESIKERARKIINSLKEIVARFVATINRIINKIVLNTKIVTNYIAKHRKEIEEFPGSRQKISVTYMITNPENIKSEYKVLQDAIRVSDMFLKLNFRDPKVMESKMIEMNKTIKDMHKRLIEVNTYKEETPLSKDLVKGALNFIERQYRELAIPLKQSREKSKEVLKNSVKNFKEYVENDNNLSETAKRIAIMNYLVGGKVTISFIIKATSKFISMLNQVYVDSFKICRAAVSFVKKQNKKGLERVEEVGVNESTFLLFDI